MPGPVLKEACRSRPRGLSSRDGAFLSYRTQMPNPAWPPEGPGVHTGYAGQRTLPLWVRAQMNATVPSSALVTLLAARPH
jgi:hypothetical protein